MLSWSSSQWDLNNMVEEEMESDLCAQKVPKFLLFPERTTYKEALEMTKKMKAELVAPPQEEEDRQRIKREMEEINQENLRNFTGF